MHNHGLPTKFANKVVPCCLLLPLQGHRWGSSTALAAAAAAAMESSSSLGPAAAEAAALEPRRHSAFAANGSAPAAAGVRGPSPSGPASSLKFRRFRCPSAAAPVEEGAGRAEALPSAAEGAACSRLHLQGTSGKDTASAAAAAAAAAEREAEAAAAEAAEAVRGHVLGGRMLDGTALAGASSGGQMQRVTSVEVYEEQEDVVGALLQLAWQDGTPQAPWVVS